MRVKLSAADTALNMVSYSIFFFKFFLDSPQTRAERSESIIVVPLVNKS